MKNLITGIAILSMLSLFSCTKVIYTHEQVLNQYMAKPDVIKRFGIPTEKVTKDSTEEWLYRYDSYNTITQHSIEEYHNTQTASVTEFNRYKRYLIFTFDLKGNVIRNDFQGVDLSIKKKNTVATIALITAGAAVILGGTLYASNHLFDGWTWTPY
jgi:hypothetical protein